MQRPRALSDYPWIQHLASERDRILRGPQGAGTLRDLKLMGTTKKFGPCIGSTVQLSIPRKRTRNSLPRPSSLRTVMVAPIDWQRCFTIASPRPDPPVRRTWVRVASVERGALALVGPEPAAPSDDGAGAAPRPHPRRATQPPPRAAPDTPALSPGPSPTHSPHSCAP